MTDRVKAAALMIAPINPDHIRILAHACQREWSDAASHASACAAYLQLYQGLYGLSLPQLVLLAIYGFAYCYIASAPGLVVHATRQWLMEEKLRLRLAVMGGVILLPLVAFAVCGYRAVLLAAVILIVGQVALLVGRLCCDDVLSFQQSLHRARRHPKIELDSYRHLREHGNAFFIVMLELVFLAIALAARQALKDLPYWPGLLISLWILPGAMVYFLGHRIERLMVDGYSGG